MCGYVNRTLLLIPGVKKAVPKKMSHSGITTKAKVELGLSHRKIRSKLTSLPPCPAPWMVQVKWPLSSVSYEHLAVWVNKAGN